MNRRKFLGTLAAAGATLAASRAFAGPAVSGLRSNFAFKKEDTPVILEVAINGSATKKVNPTAPETPADDVVGRFVASLPPGFHAARRTADEPYPLSPDGPLPRRIEAWSCVARDQDPTASGARLRFSLRVFEYASAGEATSALMGLSATAEGSVLLKAPLLAVQLGSSVLRLDGACNFSRERWVEVQDALIRALPPDGAASGALEIQCGGSVVRTPASGSPGGGRRR